MNTWAIVILICTVGITNVISLIIGVKVGQKVGRNEEIKLPEIKLPEINSAKFFSETEESKKAEVERKNMEIMLENIDIYDGTDLGQKDLKRW